MHLANLIIYHKKRGLSMVIALLVSNFILAQDNSPYSRYGLGDLSSSRNIVTRGMGGISAGYSDFQSINFVNPAALGNIRNTIFDLGTEVDVRVLKSTSPAKKFTSTNALFSYLQLAFPIGSQKMAKKNQFLGLNFGLRPVSRIGYKIEKNERLPDIDSVNTLYEGNGSLNQVYLGTGLRISNFSIGFNVGYMFGNKEFSSRRSFINDSVIYYKSNASTKSSFSGIFFNAAAQYLFKINNESTLRIGAYGSLKQKLDAQKDDIRETFSYDGVGNTFQVDSIYEKRDVKGSVEYPANFGLGFTYSNAHWLVGADYESTLWDNYRFYDAKDEVQNTYTLRVGAQYYPAKPTTPVNKYFNFVKYRAGFYYGPDYVKLSNVNRPEYALTIGAGMPLTSLRRINYTGEYVILNTALELGSRGNKDSNVRENIMRFSVGLSMNASWFRRVKYN